MENKQNEKAARRLSILFVAIVAVVIVAICACIFMEPYDSGILTGASLSGNNHYGGTVTVTNDYIFYVKDGKILRQDRGTGAVQAIYEGEVSHLNPFDGWLYFVQDGTIMRTAYYGGMTMQIGTARQVKSMSVNGLWIYYLDENGLLGKVRSDGEKQSTLTDGSVHFTAFESANRIILATDGKKIYRMKTDGSECKVLVEGNNITRMIYTLDNLYYCDEGKVLQMKSVEAGQDDGTSYGGLAATLFNYNVDDEGRGNLFYVKGQELRVKKLQSIEHDTEEDRLLVKVTDITDLYSIGDDLYYHDRNGSLYLVRISDAECTVEPVK